MGLCLGPDESFVFNVLIGPEQTDRSLILLSSSHFDLIHAYRQEQSWFPTNKQTFPIRYFCQSKSQQNFFELSFPKKKPASGCSNKFRPRRTTGSSKFDCTEASLKHSSKLLLCLYMRHKRMSDVFGRPQTNTLPTITHSTEPRTSKRWCSPLKRRSTWTSACSSERTVSFALSARNVQCRYFSSSSFGKR